LISPASVHLDRTNRRTCIEEHNVIKTFPLTLCRGQWFRRRRRIWAPFLIYIIIVCCLIAPPLCNLFTFTCSDCIGVRFVESRISCI
jgi:hypothetical protein